MNLGSGIWTDTDGEREFKSERLKTVMAEELAAARRGLERATG